MKLEDEGVSSVASFLDHTGLPPLLPVRKTRAGVEQLVEVARYGVSYEQVAGGPTGELDRELNEWARQGFRITRVDDWERMVFTYIVFAVDGRPVVPPVGARTGRSNDIT